MTTTVTTSVVFTDLVGSTELASSLGPAAAEEIRAIHFGLLRDAVAATGGSEVKSLGDGVMVVYPSLGGALDGAVAMQQAIEHHNRRASVTLAVRIGVSSGDAVEDQGDYYGDPVVEAARLCDSAEGGHIVTTDMVRLLARRTDHLFTALGPVELKGLPEPVDAWEVRWDPIKTQSHVPLPGRLAAAPATGVVGRALERERLLSFMKVAFAGEGHRVVLLSGEPGIGKTTLAGLLAQAAHDQGATVLYGRCDVDLGVPYQPFVEALGEFVAHAPDATLVALDDGGHLSELSRLLPQIRDRLPELAEPPSTDADAERYLLFGAITGVLGAMASTAPVVVVLDDLHWAAKPTVLLLHHLATTLDRAEVLVIGTYRNSDLTATHPLTEGLASLRREARVERVAVDGLDDTGVVALLEAMAGHELDDAGIELAHAVRADTDGNPFFTTEVLRHLAETGAIRQDDERWVATVDLSSIGLPESVREVVGQRVRHLGDEVQQILTTASVIGREFDLDLLARVAERDEDDVLDALEEAAATQIVAEVAGRPERFTFTHALFQHTLYEELSATRRVRTHRRIGKALEDAYGADPGDRIGELAHHWIAATKPADAGKAAGYARLAGERALAALAPDEAIRWFREAVGLLDGDGSAAPLDRLDVLIGLGDAQRQAGDFGYRETLLHAAREAARLGDTDRLVSAALANQRGMVSSIGSIDAERVAMLEQALHTVDASDHQTRAELLAALAAELPFSGDHHRARKLAADAESMARRLGDDSTLLRVLNLTFLPRWVPDGFERTVAASQEAVTLADQIGDPVARFWAAMNRVNAMSSAVDRAGIDEALGMAASLAEEIGQPFLTWRVLQVRCPHVLLTGDADEADRLAAEALEVGADLGEPDAFAVYGANLAGIRWQQGRLDEILPLIAEAVADNPGLPAFKAAYAMMLCECGRTEEAKRLVDEARRADFHDAARDFVWLTNTTVWADTSAWLADTVAADLLYQRLSPFEPQGVFTGSTFNGTVGMYLARLAVVLGREADARGLFERADAQLRALQAPFWHARNQIDWARLLGTSGTEGDLHHAWELLAEAAATADTWGCAGLLRRADELDRAIGRRDDGR